MAVCVFISLHDHGVCVFVSCVCVSSGIVSVFRVHPRGWLAQLSMWEVKFLYAALLCSILLFIALVTCVLL